MSKILCPFCFEQFKSSQTLFRCINSRCSGQAPDKTYAKYQGLLSAPKLGLSFAPREGGIKKIAGLFQGPREVSCPTCQRPTPKRICPTCHYELMYDAGRTKERTIAVIGGRSAGKSIYITALMNCLFNQVGTITHPGWWAMPTYTAQGDRSVRQLCAPFGWYLARNTPHNFVHLPETGWHSAQKMRIIGVES